ncbi:MAG: protein kinase [Terriglobales bacterium]
MVSDPLKMAGQIRFGEDFELDLRAYELRRAGQVLKLERIPMELLLLLIEGRGQLVARNQIIERIWGRSVFLDTDNSINAAIRKIRHALKDDPEQPRFVQTITGRGYRFIAQVVEVIPAPAPAEGHTEAADSLVGKKVSHYRILQVLGGGGMGVVYKAEDLKLGRRVAIKFLPVEVAHDAKAFERFEREARAASALDHHNICSIHELGEYENQPFIVMQLLEGETLREFIETAGQQQKPLPISEVIDLAMQVVKGLEAAHEKRIVHRDIKPANIFITNRGEAKILDFGLAKMVEEDPNPEAYERIALTETAIPTGPAPPPSNLRLTLTGTTMGTAYYMSPEQVRGEKLDARTDLFSFGLVLYEMATGRRAFSGDTVPEIHDAVLHQFAVPARQVRPDLPVDLERIITKAIEKDRELRYQTATQVRDDLQCLSIAASPKPVDSTVPPAKNVIDVVQRPRRKLGLWRSVALALPVAALASGAFYYRSVHANRLNETDTIVIADFANSTGDLVLGGALKQGLDIALRQSPFLSIVSDDRVDSTLKGMTLPADTFLTPDVAREVCQRTGSKAYVGGAIAALGTEYVLGLKAVNCQSGDVMVREQITAPAKEKVIAALGDAASKLRGELGESLSTVQKYDVPLEEATTPSLEALKAFSLARAAALKGSMDNAIPFYKHAIEVDPNFAAAYAHLAQAYASSSQGDLAKASIQQAFELRQRASEPEKLYIVTRYYEIATGETDKRIEALRLWRQMYPRETTAANDLAAEYNDMGKFDLALASAQDALRLSPDAYTPYENLGMAYLGLNRFSEAKAIRKKELAANLGLHWTHIDLYGIAVVENDLAGMHQEIDWAKGKNYEFFMLESVAGVQAAAGRLQMARETYRQAMENARRAKFDGVARNMAVDLDLVETELGNVSRSRRARPAVPNSEHGREAAAHIFATSGDLGHAGALASELLKDAPTDTYVNNVWVPSIQAEIEVSRGDPEKAIELLKATSPYEFGWKAHGWPSYVRGLAYLRARKGKEAATEFQKFLDHRGVCLADSLAPLFYALSHLQLARARAMTGDAAGARTAYQDFFNLWKDADSDIPILKRAKVEYAKLR